MQTMRIKWTELILETLKRKNIAFMSSPDVLCWGENEFKEFCIRYKIEIQEDLGADGFVLISK